MNKDLSSEFRERMQKATNQELVNFFNREVGNTGWCSARSYYLAALCEEITMRDFDSSIILNGGGLSLSRNVRLIDNQLIFEETKE